MPFLTGKKYCFISFSHSCFVIESGGGGRGSRSMPFLMGKKYVLFRFLITVSSSSRAFGSELGRCRFLWENVFCFVFLFLPRRWSDGRVLLTAMSRCFFFYRKVLGGETGRFEQPAAAGLPTLAWKEG